MTNLLLLEIPPALREFAMEANLPFREMARLVELQRLAAGARTAAGWRELWEGLKGRDE